MQREPDTIGPFRPAWWLRNGHLQTLWPSIIRRSPRIETRREMLETPDGDVLDLRWAGEGPEKRGSPIVVILHGLEGSIRSNYVRGLMRRCAQRGWRSVLVHCRGCGGEPNRLRRGYYAGDTDDVSHVVSELARREPGVRLAAVGYSLGGNMLLKWLADSGRDGTETGLSGAVGVSVPYDLDNCSRRINRGVARLYRWHLLRVMRASVRRKMAVVDLGIDLGGEELANLKTFHQFDDRITAPIHGFDGVDDYYSKCSCGPLLSEIRTPTCLIHALDDPFMTPDVAPGPGDVSGQVELRFTRRGGHVGFVSGRWPWAATYWLEEAITAWLGRRFEGEPSAQEDARSERADRASMFA